MTCGKATSSSFASLIPAGRTGACTSSTTTRDTDRQLRLPTNSHVILINALGTKGQITPELAAVLDVMNRRWDNQNPLAVSLVKEIDGYNRDKKRRRALVNLQMRLKDEWRLGLSEGRAEGLAKGRAEGRAEGRDETMLSLIHTLQMQGQSQKQIVETIASMQKSSLATAQHYYEQLTEAANGGER